MTSQHKTNTHPFSWQAGIRPALIHFYDKPAEDQFSSIFVTSWHKTSAHPFYIGMYIHIYTHIYVHKFTSQKECLQGIFTYFWRNVTAGRCHGLFPPDSHHSCGTSTTGVREKKQQPTVELTDFFSQVDTWFSSSWFHSFSHSTIRGWKAPWTTFPPPSPFFVEKKGKVLLVFWEPVFFFGSEEMYFGIPEGECFGYLGLNGAGKTTTMQLGVRSMLFGWVKTQRLIVWYYLTW